MKLVRYDEARRAVQEARNVEDGKDIADKALALKHYARQRRDIEMLSWIAEIHLRARRRIGELSRELADGSGPGRGKKVSSGGKVFKQDALKAAGLSVSEAHRCEKISKVPENDFERVIAEKRELQIEVSADDVERFVKEKSKSKKRSELRESIEKSPPLQTTSDLDELVSSGRKFGTIYADPPWLYSNQRTRSATSDNYSGMTVDEICALPIEKLAERDGHLHLWTTNAFLFDAKRVLDAWGFSYRSCYVWIKTQMGLGNYWRVSHEYLLLGIRGSAVFKDHTLRSWGQFPRREHSAKPEEIRGLIERASPGPYLELFARRSATGWSSWGNEIERAIYDVEETK